MAISLYKVWEWLGTKVVEELEKPENQGELQKKKAVEDLIAALEYWSNLDWTAFEGHQLEIIDATKKIPEWLQPKKLMESLKSFDDEKAKGMSGSTVESIKELFHQKAIRLAYRYRLKLQLSDAQDASKTPASSRAKAVIASSTARYRGTGGGELGNVGELGFFGVFLVGLWAIVKTIGYGIKKTYKSTVNLFKGKKTLRSWWRLACTLGAGGYVGYIVVAALLTTTTPVGWIIISAAVAVGVAAAIGAFVGKYSAQFFSWMFHRHEVNPWNPDKYRLRQSEVEHYNKKNIRIGNGTEKDTKKNWRALFAAVLNVHRESGAEDDCNELLDIIHAGSMFDEDTVIPIRFQPQWTAFDKNGEPSKLRIAVIEKHETYDEKKDAWEVTYEEKVFTFTRGEEQLQEQSTQKMEGTFAALGTSGVAASQTHPKSQEPPVIQPVAPPAPAKQSSAGDAMIEGIRGETDEQWHVRERHRLKIPEKIQIPGFLSAHKNVFYALLDLDILLTTELIKANNLHSVGGHWGQFMIMEKPKAKGFEFYCDRFIDGMRSGAFRFDIPANMSMDELRSALLKGKPQVQIPNCDKAKIPLFKDDFLWNLLKDGFIYTKSNVPKLSPSGPSEFYFELSAKRAGAIDIVLRPNNGPTIFIPLIYEDSPEGRKKFCEKIKQYVKDGYDHEGEHFTVVDQKRFFQEVLKVFPDQEKAEPVPTASR